MPAPSSLRPILPLAKRLNQNALIVAAVVVGMTVLTVTVIVHPTRERRHAPPPAPGEETPPVPSRPTFLDQPARSPAARPDTGAARRSDGRDATAPPATDAFSAAALQPTRGPSAREKAYEAALASPAVAPESAGAGPPGPTAATFRAQADTPLATQEQQLVTLGDSIMRAAVGTPTAGGSTASRRDDRRHQAFLAAATSPRPTRSPASVDAAGSPYTLRAGTVVPGLLLTAINSDLPGDLVGQVSRDVYDSRTERTLLIPKGARLIGTYDNQVAVGEDRLLVAWTRLIFPDGRSLRLPGLALKDEAGQTGTKDQVDTHWRRAFGNALLLSAISAGVQLSQPPQTSLLGTPSAGQIAAGALGQELSNVALELLRRGMDTPPTIVIRQGHPFNVFLNGDLVLGGPYEDHPDSARRSGNRTEQ
jgi:type IV secretory pathway VirB10-like protein